MLWRISVSRNLLSLGLCQTVSNEIFRRKNEMWLQHRGYIIGQRNATHTREQARRQSKCLGGALSAPLGMHIVHYTPIYLRTLKSATAAE